MLLDVYESMLKKTQNLQVATQASDILTAHANGRIAAILAIEGGEALGKDLHNLVMYYERGVRLMTITWNRRNHLARGVGAVGDDGLSEFGKEAIRLMNEVGMLVDVSHLSDQAFYELLDVAKAPIVASHSNSRSLCPHPRNLSDEQAKLIAQSGGLAAVTFAGCFIDPNPVGVNLSRLVEHIDHLVSVMGIDHVALGSDFDGFGDSYGSPVQSCLDLNLIDKALEAKGYGKAERAKIMGTNWYGVIKAVCG